MLEEDEVKKDNKRKQLLLPHPRRGLPKSITLELTDKDENKQLVTYRSMNQLYERTRKTTDGKT